MKPFMPDRRKIRLPTVFFWCAVAVSIKLFVGMLMDYRWYLPPDFDQSAFLSGRQLSFTGLYPLWFYVHIVSSPIALLLGTFLIVSGSRGTWPTLHRYVGRIQGMIVLFFVVPSGLWMAGQAYAGAVAVAGFLGLSVVTGATMLGAIHFARSKQSPRHRLWAARCYLMLWSPLLLRLIAGITIATGLETEWTYRMNAWISWLIPLLVFEVSIRRRIAQNESRKPILAETIL